jgi:valyl-tRNA synthetase
MVLPGSFPQGIGLPRLAPTLWCPECRTAIAQAEVDDLERESEFFTLSFLTPEEKTLPIATTRPELLPACVAVFVHPEDPRYRGFAGGRLSVPLFGQIVPILEDYAADPDIGTGAVMCCTFGDVTDKAWWQAHHLPLVEVIGQDGRLTNAAVHSPGFQ